MITSQGTANTGKNLSEGTQLISDLINDGNTTTITLNENGINRTQAVNSKTKKPLTAIPENNTGYDAAVHIKGTDPNTINIDGSRGVKGGSFITLGHELQHARDLVTGQFNNDAIPSVFDFDIKKVMNANDERPFTVREFKTRMFENKIRHEQGKILRALPLPIIPFQF